MNRHSSPIWSCCNALGFRSALLLLFALPLLGCEPTAGSVPGAAAPPAAASAASSVALAPSNARIAQGSGQRFAARALFPDGRIRDVAAQLQWSVLDEQGQPAASAIAANGLITVEKPGHYRVRAAQAGRVLEALLEVTTATLKSVAITPLSPSVGVGAHQKFTLTGTYSDGTTQDVSMLAAWSVKSVIGSGVASIDSSGLVTTKAVGKVQVTGRYSGHQSSTNLQVTPAVITSLAVAPRGPTILKGGTVNFAATATFSDATQQDVTALATWSVQDVMGTTVAAIDEFGSAQGLSVGQAAVAADYSGLSDSTTLTVTNPMPTTYKLASDSLKLPKSTGSGTYSLDYDGDGKTENQFRNLVNVVSLVGLDFQGALNSEIAGGDGIELFGITTPDPLNAASVTVEGNSAKLHVMGTPLPKFDGSDVFSALFPTGAKLSGALVAGKLSTTLPPLVTAATEQRMQVRLSLAGVPLLIPLRGVHIEGTLVHSGALWRIQDGALHGAISQTDIDGTIIPAVANLITQLIHSDTMGGVPGDTAKTMIGLFETTGNPASVTKCMVSANCCKVSPATCIILPAEVTASPIGGVLAPDVQVFDTSNRWAPVPGGKSYNGMSFGMGFSAVTASY